jgi:carbonic anhydrase/acetyltransferase-like protein (isoleucine patch superfamily)
MGPYRFADWFTATRLRPLQGQVRTSATPKLARRRRPGIESLESRELLSLMRLKAPESRFLDRTAAQVSAAVVANTAKPASSALSPQPIAADSGGETFIDPTAVLRDRRAITIGDSDYVGPFAWLMACGGGTITIGDISNVQDNAEILASGRRASVDIGDNAIVAHGATVIGPATIGAAGGAPAFVGFNAIIDRATVQPGAMVSSLAKVAPGIVIPSGYKVLPGMYIRTQAQAEDPSLGKVAPVTPCDIKFMNDVIHANETLAAGYVELKQESPKSVYGISPNPEAPPFNPDSRIPTLAGRPTVAPKFRSRIIGDVRTTNSMTQLNRMMGHDDSIRGDEGTPFVIGEIRRMGNRVTIHGLEYTCLSIGPRASFGYHSVIHAGTVPGQGPTTTIGANVTIGAWAVVFRSIIGKNCVIGPYAYIDGSQLKPGTIVPRGAIIIDNQYVGRVQWIC